MKLVKGFCYTLVILVFLLVLFMMMIGGFGSIT